jgi:hypothetical protein
MSHSEILYDFGVIILSQYPDDQAMPSKSLDTTVCQALTHKCPFRGSTPMGYPDRCVVPRWGYHTTLGNSRTLL